MKTAINHWVFFNLIWGEWMNLRNSSGIELRNFYFTTVQKLVSKIFIRSGKLQSCMKGSFQFKLGCVTYENRNKSLGFF